MQTPLTFLAAFIVVLALIGLAAWLVRRFSGNNLGNMANRGRMPRLAVIDAAAVDGRRRLVLVRRDNVEHLLMIGGPTDVVVELNIVRAMPARDGAPGRPGELPRAPVPDAAGWSDTENRPDDLDAAEPEPASRRSAPSFADEVRRMPVPPERERRITESTALAPDMPPARPEPPARQEQRSDPGMPRPPRPSRPDVPPRSDMAPRPRLAETLSRLPRTPEPASAASSSSTPSSSAAEAEKELTDMAQRLEAALRRPPAPPVIAKSSSSAEAGASSAPIVEPPRAPAPNSSAPPVSAPEAPALAASTGRSGFENLEDEMASLLGRPKSPT